MRLLLLPPLLAVSLSCFAFPASAQEKTAPAAHEHRHVHKPHRVSRAIPLAERPVLAGVEFAAPAIYPYPVNEPQPHDDAAIFTPAYWLDGLALGLTVSPPPPTCIPTRQIRRDVLATLPGAVPGAPLYCAPIGP